MVLQTRAAVCHLTSVHHPFDTRIFHKECRSLAEAGYDVTLLASHDRDEIVDGVRIIALRKARTRPERMTRIAWAVYQKALQVAADIYHFHDLELIPAGLLLKAAGHKVIYDIHEDAPRAILSPGHHYLPAGSKGVISWLLERLERVSARRFSACIAATPGIEGRFKSVQANTIVINNYPILDEMVNTDSRSWGEREMAVAYVGGIGSARGLREMVKAMESVQAQLGARLKLAGKFADLSFRQEATRIRGWQYVDELGFLNRKEVRKLLGSVRAGLVVIHPEPRYMIAQPVKLYEYMAAGIPVIASDFPMWRELIHREKCGLVVDPINPRAIGSAIEYLLTHDAEAEEMGRRGREAVEQRYNWTREADKLKAIYASVLNRDLMG